MNLIPGKQYDILVKPGSKKNQIVLEEPITVFVTARAQDNKANEAVVKLFKKELKLKVVMTQGLKSKYKAIRILN